MLVISRTRGESIIIGKDISITIVEVRGNTVRLGFAAPKDITILRGELKDKTRTPPTKDEIKPS